MCLDICETRKKAKEKKNDLNSNENQLPRRSKSNAISIRNVRHCRLLWFDSKLNESQVKVK